MVGWTNLEMSENYKHHARAACPLVHKKYKRGLDGCSLLATVKRRGRDFLQAVRKVLSSWLAKTRIYLRFQKGVVYYH